jgi:hypothetical protein
MSWMAYLAAMLGIDTTKDELHEDWVRDQLTFALLRTERIVSCQDRAAKILQLLKEAKEVKKK